MKYIRYSVRVRLTLWYTAALASIMAVFSAGIYIYVKTSLMNQIDHELQRDADAISAIIQKKGYNLHELRETEEFKAAPVFMIKHGDGPAFTTTSWRKLHLHNAFGTNTNHQNHAPRFIWKSPDGKIHRINSSPYTIRGESYIITVAQQADAVMNSLHTLAWALFIGMPFLLLTAALGGWFMAGKVLAPVAALAATAREISAESLDRRLPVINPDDEFGALASVFNDTLTRLQNSFELLQRFTSDASNELRTPLTALRSVGEVGLHAETDSKSCRNIIGSMLEEADRLALLVDNLLTLTRLDATRKDEHSQKFDLSEMLRDIVRCLQVLAEEKKQTMTLEAEETVKINANPTAIRQAITNLLDNAIKYTPEHGCICLSVKQYSEGYASVTIRDNGPGIAARHQQHVFERFYRIDENRSSASGGTGLGLAIAQQAVERNGGQIKLESEPGNGCTFTIQFTTAQKER